MDNNLKNANPEHTHPKNIGIEIFTASIKYIIRFTTLKTYCITGLCENIDCKTKCSCK